MVGGQFEVVWKEEGERESGVWGSEIQHCIVERGRIIVGALYFSRSSVSVSFTTAAETACVRVW